MSSSGRKRSRRPDGGFLSLEGVDPSRIHREWQLTNTLWALTSSAWWRSAMLLVSLPLLAVLYLPVRLSSRAPFFFRQRAAGVHGATSSCIVQDHDHAAWQRQGRLATSGGSPSTTPT